MKQLYEDLWISTPEFPAGEEEPELMMHGFLLQHLRGNLLISRVENPEDHQVIADRGGIIRHYLTHWHEAGPACGCYSSVLTRPSTATRGRWAR